MRVINKIGLPHEASSICFRQSLDNPKSCYQYQQVLTVAKKKFEENAQTGRSLAKNPVSLKSFNTKKN